ncbi:MAG: cupin domain-containing protein [Acidobacteria bacterium]|nr:MAG: cupin domain-containing protein [Acidobacteriota bacterium]
MKMRIYAHASRQDAALTPDGAERRVLSYGGGLMLVQFTFKPDVASFEHSHPHEQIGYVVSGEIDVFMEGSDVQRLTTGGSYYVPPNVRHYIKTYAPTVLIDAFTPVREDFLEQAVH